MRADQWNALEQLVQGSPEEPKAALIVDSPWIPPFLGLSTEEYITSADLHL
ncbi:MAG: uroporphyrinogen decarboxylase, partial [Spirochaetaceae bacterium]